MDNIKFEALNTDKHLDKMVSEFLAKPENSVRFNDEEKYREGLKDFLYKYFEYQKEQRAKRIWQNRLESSEEQSE